MIVGIHQLNYFPWVGYFDKVEKSDIFIIMDEVQLITDSYMQRNRVLNQSGQPSWLSVSFQKENFRDKKFSEIKLNDSVDWQKRQKDFLVGTYNTAPYFSEVLNLISPIFENKYDTLFEVNKKAFDIIIDMLDIKTKVILQSSLDYDRTAKKNDLVLELCKAVNADCYFSGAGAKKYMDETPFAAAGINVVYQNYLPFEYPQKFNSEFMPGLSILDVLLNCGIEKTKKLFWLSQEK
ncbi:MAG: WbqC family protein [Clostridia bacterium]|nr:WbqC family protein [Clostridia bacterium]